MNTFLKVFGAFLTIAIVVLIICALLALPTMWLWNGCLVDAVSGVKEIGFWQALGLNVLCSILFKNTVETK